MSEPPRRASGHARARRWGRRLARAPVAVPVRALRFAGGRARDLFRRAPLPPGARPGTLSIPADAPPPRLHAFVYGPGRCEEHAVPDAAALAALRDEDAVTWIDVQGFGNRAAIDRIRETFDIHPLAMADIVNVPQRPKVEDYEDRHLIVARMARLEPGGELVLEQVSFVLGPGWLLTFQERPGDVFEPVRERLRAGVGLLRQSGPDYLAYALIDALVDGYFPVVEALGELLEGLEEEVMGRPKRATLIRIHRVRRTLLALHRIQWRQRDALSTLARDESMPFRPEVRVYLRDVHDHAVQILDVIETYRELAVGLMDIYLSSVSNRMNQVMKTLTVMATIFIPLTFLAGIYGMNFENMPELRWRWGYYAVWGVMLGVALALLAWFWLRGWLGNDDLDEPPQ